VSSYLPVAVDASRIVAGPLSGTPAGMVAVRCAACGFTAGGSVVTATGFGRGDDLDDLLPVVAVLGQELRGRDEHRAGQAGLACGQVFCTGSPSAPTAATPPSCSPPRRNSTAGTASETPKPMAATAPSTYHLSRRRAAARPISETPAAISQAPSYGASMNSAATPVTAALCAHRAHVVIMRHRKHYGAQAGRAGRVAVLRQS
jgi:hypothetical protein